MAQHFLLSAKARTLSVRKVMEITDEQAFQFFKEMRWGKGEEVVCPLCGSVDKHYFKHTRRQWRCKACSHTFSVTSGTIFAFHKLPLKVYLAAITIYTNAVKGLSALQMSRDLGVAYKTAFVLAHKIRESLMEQRNEDPLAGEVHVDGAYVNGHIRPKNKKEKRIDRRLAIYQKPGKRCVLVMRQKCEELAGARKTLTFVLKSENRADDGTTNNLAESYFSRFRRMQYGQVHKFGNLYLSNYTNEAAYREDTRRWSNGDIFRDIVKKCAKTRTHHDWCGYWQGNKRATERLAA